MVLLVPLASIDGDGFAQLSSGRGRTAAHTPQQSAPRRGVAGRRARCVHSLDKLGLNKDRLWWCGCRCSCRCVPTSQRRGADWLTNAQARTKARTSDQFSVDVRLALVLVAALNHNDDEDDDDDDDAVLDEGETTGDEPLEDDCDDCDDEAARMVLTRRAGMAVCVLLSRV
ncbi:hypothetical protein BC831DRAFT_449361 [Entophlyctis helioformis]|nr:hypothetical protein BC831DRAFT_449361 [Entophlyctis helioformis]